MFLLIHSKVLIIMFLESLLVSVSSILYTPRFGYRRRKHIGQTQTVFRAIEPTQIFSVLINNN